jgi:hypothetical protein
VIGTELGRYRITSLLGEGGMGSVYLAVQPAIGSRVAIKVLSEQCARDPDLLERFFAEAKAVNLIRHEHIVSVLDLATLPDGRPYIVMEYVEGQTLAAIVRGKSAPLGGVLQVMGEVLSALAAAHAIGIVHRDLKPDNVLVTAEGHAKVLDFGIAKLAPGLHDASARTKTGALLGTPAYMAPEQISGAGNVDARADIYAAGILLYEAVTGRVPFSGGSIFDIMRAQVDDTPAPPRTLRADLPAGVEAVILTALQKDPALRFQSAQAMAQALAHAAQALPQHQWIPLSSRGGPRISASAPQQATPVAITEAPPKRTGLIVAVIAVLAVAVGIGLFVASRSTTEPLPIDAAMVVPIDAAKVIVAQSPPVDAAPAPKPVHARAIDAGPTVVKGGSAADHHVYVGDNVQIGSNVIVGSQTPAAPRDEISERADFDPKHFDPVAYLPKALALAQRLAPDAHLTELEFDPVFPDGHVDLTMDGRDREYNFRSPARSARPTDLPKNVPYDRTCMIHVEVGAREVTASLRTSDMCDARLVRAPRCHFGGVWKQASAAGAPGDIVARIGWLFDEKWFFDTDLGGDGKGMTTSFADACP